MGHCEPGLGAAYGRSCTLAVNLNSIIDKYIQIRRTAAAIQRKRQPLYISVLLQIVQCSFYRGAGAVELGSYGVDPRPALALFV